MQPLYLQQLESTPIDWIWEGRIARGMITLLEADPEMGKGLISMDIAARLTRGSEMPGEIRNPQSAIRNYNVLLCTSEDSQTVAQKPRAEAAGADLARIATLPASQVQFAMKPKDSITYVLQNMESILANGDYALVIIDPLNGFFEALGAAGDRSARHTMTQLTLMAERKNCAILAVRHLTKTTGKSAIYRGSGVISFTAVCRFVFCIGHAPSPQPDPKTKIQNPKSKILACTKSNISAHPPSLAYNIVPAENGSARIEWLGTSDLTADEILARPTKPHPPSAESTAIAWLTGLLSNGPIPETRIRELADKAGIHKNSLHNAKASIQAASCKRGYGVSSDWIWYLPDHNPNNPHDLKIRTYDIYKLSPINDIKHYQKKTPIAKDRRPLNQSNRKTRPS